jgi:DNA-binding transcriptional regulator GbsR (MarR family)
MELWGFKRIMGRTWAVLYLSPEPLTAADLSRKLQISAGSVSMTIHELMKWGVVRKTWVPGDRRDFYQPETSIWKMVSRVFRERELFHIRDAIEAFHEAQRLLLQEDAAARRDRDEPARRTIAFVAGRVKSLLTLGEAGRRLLELVLSGTALGGTPLQDLLDE